MAAKESKVDVKAVKTMVQQSVREALTISYGEHLSTLTGAMADAKLVGDLVYISFLARDDGDHTCMRFDEFALFVAQCSRVLTMARDARERERVSDLECTIANLGG